MQPRTLWDMAVEQLTIRRSRGWSHILAALHSLRRVQPGASRPQLDCCSRASAASRVHAANCTVHVRCATGQSRSRLGALQLPPHHEAVELVFVSVCRELGCVPSVMARHRALNGCFSLQVIHGMSWVCLLERPVADNVASRYRCVAVTTVIWSSCDPNDTDPLRAPQQLLLLLHGKTRATGGHAHHCAHCNIMVSRVAQ